MLREGFKKEILQFSPEVSDPPPLMEKKLKKAKNDLCTMKQILYDMGYGSSDTCQMTSLQRYKDLTHPSDQDPS